MNGRAVVARAAPLRRVRSNGIAAVDDVVQVVSGAFSVGPVTRTELLATAVAAHASTSVFDVLLRLPERRYHDVFDLRGQLLLMTG